MTRVFFDFLGTPPNWWGVTSAYIGTISALLGVLYALMEHDLKRLLAYHSIENIGIILMGLGAALMFRHANNPLLARWPPWPSSPPCITPSTTPFQSVAFPRRRRGPALDPYAHMEEMGGLIKRMPKTALFFLVGAVAISACRT